VIGRIPILDIEPMVECGRRPAKAVVGETFQVSATVIREGHGALGAGVVLRDPAGNPGPLVRMRELAPGTDRYGADVTVTSEGAWQFHVEAWSDPIKHWHHDAAIKIPRGQDVELMLAEGALLYERAAKAIKQPPGAARPAAARASLVSLAKKLRDRSLPPWDRLAATESPEIAEIMAAFPLRDMVTRSARLPVAVDRLRALYGAWYEFFPRSEGVQFDPMGRREPVSGTLRTAARRLEAIAEMGFDVVYLPPVHPIGTTFRKGRNNTLEAQAGDPGSPWAIGSPEGGHHPGRRVDRLRGEPAEEVPGHLSAQLRQRPGRHIPGDKPDRPVVDGPRRADLPRRQPAHQAAPVLGATARRHPRDRPGRDLPGRGVHQAGHDEDAGKNRLPPVLHLFHLAEHQSRVDRVPHRAVG
jgi:hypothetical protein